MKQLTVANTKALTAIETLPLARQAVLPNDAKAYAVDLPMGKAIGWWPAAHSLQDANYDFTNDPGYFVGAYARQDTANLFIAYAIKHLGLDQSAIRGLELGAYTAQSAVLMSSVLAPTSLWLVSPAEEAYYGTIKQGILAWGGNSTWIIPELLNNVALLPNYADLIQYHAPIVSADPFLEASKGSNQWAHKYLQLEERKQLRGLKSVVKGLKANGYLFYINRSTNNLLGSDFVAKNMEAEGLCSVRLPLDASWEVEECQCSESGCYSYQFAADSLTEASFSLMIFYKEGQDEVNKAMKQEPLTGFVQDYKVADWFAAPDSLMFEKVGKVLYSFPKVLLNDYMILSEVFERRYLGYAIADWKDEEWVPRQEVAWNVELSSNLACIELELKEALAFIKGEEIGSLPKVENTGFYLVKYKGIGLGWLEIEASA